MKSQSPGQIAHPLVEGDTEALRVVIALTVQLLVIGGSLMFLVSYAVSGQYALIPWIALPFLIPSSLFFLHLHRQRRYATVLWFLFYFYTVLGLMKLTTAPDYLVDLFLLPAYIGAAFLMLRYQHAALMVIYLLAMFGIAAAIVHWFEPFPVIYTNENLSSVRTGFLLSIISSTAMCFAFARNYQRNTDRLGDSLYALGKVNDDNQLLINVVSHDVRNYLARLVLLIDLSKSRTEGRARLEELGNLEATVHELTKLVTDLPMVRDLSAAGARRTTQPVAFDEIMKKIDLIFRHLMVEKRLSFDKLGVEPLLVDVNPDIFTHIILSNLVGNAIKFSAPGGTIALGLTEQGGMKVLAITNQAPVAHLPNLRRVASGGQVASSLPGTLKEQGQGLGISILRRFCRLYGIEFTMSVDVAPGQDHCAVTSKLVFASA